MLKIVTSNGGLHLSTDEQMVKYIKNDTFIFFLME